MPLVPERTEGFLKERGLLVALQELPCEQGLAGRPVLQENYHIPFWTALHQLQ